MTEHIRVGDLSPRIQYLGNATQTAFTYPFPILAAADLDVWLDDTRQSAGFSVTGAGEQAGGTVTFAVAPAAGVRVTLRRHLALRRVTDFQDDGIIRARSLNDELDTQAMILQQLGETLDRTVQRRLTSVSSADLALPEPAAGRALKWNADASGLANTDADPDAALAQVLAAATTATDRAAVAVASATTASAAATTATDRATAATNAATSAAGSASTATGAATTATDKATAAVNAATGAATAATTASAAATTATAQAAAASASAAVLAAYGPSGSGGVTNLGRRAAGASSILGGRRV